MDKSVLAQMQGSCLAPRSGSPRLMLVILAVFGTLLIGAGLAYAAEPEQDLTSANADVQRALTAARAGDLATAKQQYDRFENTWFNIEDGIRAKSRDAYRTIEKFMTDVSVAFGATPADASKVVTALSALDQENQLFIQGKPSSSIAAAAPGSASVPATTSPTSNPTMGTLLDLLAAAKTDLANGSYDAAAARLRTFNTDWLEVEGQVKTRSADDYRSTENDMALALSLVTQRSPEAAAVVNRMATRLEPYRTATSYGVFDAAIILLREGLEALLIVVALLAFLKRSGNASGQVWVWAGAGVGLLASVLLGLGIQAFFGSIINPSNRELMEGVIGLFAAGMLVYVSYWLHSKASADGWQRYLSQRTRTAVSGGSLVGLAVLSFLAIFREGAETALFYLGMIGNIAMSDLLLGLGIGFGLLALLGFLMTVVGVRIPMRPFFAVASLLVFYLCFKFVGTGIHALQVAGIVPSPSASFLPSIEALGMYSTWPTTIAQFILLVVGLAVVLRDRIASTTSSPARRIGLKRRQP